VRTRFAGVLALLLLAGCGLEPSAAAPVPTDQIIPARTPAPGTNTFLSTTPQVLQPLSPAARAPIPVPTDTAAPPATAIAPSYVYFFPVQPPEVCDYAEGVQGHGYPATDIFAAKGVHFVAVTGGVVDFVSTQDVWDPVTDDPATRSGLAVAIIGDDGVRYYGSHLSEVEAGIAPGVRVEAGQLLGKVGNTGDARGKDVHLHFGISHPTYPEDWHTRRGEVDPFPYLEAWQINVYIRPKLP